MADWEIERPLGQCCGTERQIEPGEEYFAALVKTADGFARRDFSAQYWEANQPDVFCYWKTKLPEPNQKKKLFVDDEMLMAFFERLTNETDQEKINFRFVLALILMRKKKLKYDTSRTEDGKEIWVLRISGEKTTADVVNPNLTEKQVEQLSGQVEQVMAANL
ncbi:MAG: hypothetical protein PHF37_06090 [Phycisphaerae bacterium]|nr:hypothetical protein [Phycisphaerae bacterium]